MCATSHSSEASCLTASSPCSACPTSHVRTPLPLSSLVRCDGVLWCGVCAGEAEHISTFVSIGAEMALFMLLCLIRDRLLSSLSELSLVSSSPPPPPSLPSSAAAAASAPTVPIVRAIHTVSLSPLILAHTYSASLASNRRLAASVSFSSSSSPPAAVAPAREPERSLWERLLIHLMFNYGKALCAITILVGVFAIPSFLSFGSVPLSLLLCP